LKREKKKKLEKTYVSNPTARCRKSVMFCDILDLNNVADEAIRRNAIITLRVNESTDVSNFTCLLVYCRYSNEVELKD